MNLLGLELPDLLEALSELPGVKPYTARQVYSWIYVKQTLAFDRMTNLTLPLRRLLASRFEIEAPAADKVSSSSDGTKKYLFRLGDGSCVESVWIPEPTRNTICLSTQVGCRMGCRFCATATMGLQRNLTSSEIVGQALHVLGDIGHRDLRVNIVFMGMGEGLDNYDATMKAFRLLSDPEGMAVSPRRITLSTVGLVPGIERLSQEPRAPKLAISLNAPFDADRTELMPVNRRYPISMILDAARAFLGNRHGGEPVRFNERVTFEYVLLKGVNDSPRHAHELVRLLKNVPAKLNLLAYNPAPELPFESPEEAGIETFKQLLLDANIPVSFRRSRGRDIEAACGQLATARPVRRRSPSHSG